MYFVEVERVHFTTQYSFVCIISVILHSLLKKNNFFCLRSFLFLNRRKEQQHTSNVRMFAAIFFLSRVRCACRAHWQFVARIAYVF